MDPARQEAARGASPAEQKAYLAEAGVAWVRFAVIAFNVPVYWLFLAPQGVPWLAVVISVVACLYAVIIVTFRPYERFPAMATALWTATTDSSLIVLWIHATGGFASPFYLLWYLSLFAITFRYSAKATFLASLLYAGLYTAQVGITGDLGGHLVDMAIRDTYIVLVGAVGSILARESLRVFRERFEVGRQVQEVQGLRELAEANPEAVAIVGEGIILEANRAYCRLVGKPREGVIGATPDTVTADPAVQARIFALLSRGTGEDEAWVSFDGKSPPRLVHAAATRIEYQGRPAVFVALRDVTDERASQATHEKAMRAEMEVRRLREIDRFKSDFINAAAHELNTPLTPLKLQLHILKKKLPSDSSIERRTVDMLDRNLERLVWLVDEMLDVARLNSGRLRLKPAASDLVKLVRETLDTFTETAKARDITLALQAPDSLPGVMDPQRVTQVLYNLVSNAVKFTPVGGRITVSARADGDDLEVSVADTGAGLTPEQAEHLFQPFSRQHKELDAPGTGLGLYISRGIVLRHAGTLTCSSEGPNKGATFTLRLPVQGPPPAAARPAPA